MSAPPQGSVAAEKDKRKRSLNSALEFVLIVVVALGLALAIQAWVVKPFRIPSGSMEPTLHIGQRVLVDRVTGHFGDPGGGDIVVFHPPKGSESNGEKCGVPRPSNEACPVGTKARADTNFIKRVVAVPGDRLKIMDNHAYVNGKRQADGFANLTPCKPTEPACSWQMAYWGNGWEFAPARDCYLIKQLERRRRIAPDFKKIVIDVGR